MTPKLWFAPNLGSDILGLFTRPDEWAEARKAVKVFQFFATNIQTDHVGDNPDCNENVYTKLVEVDAFRKLQDWGIEIAIEAGAVKRFREDGHGCDGREGLRLIEIFIEKVRAAGADVSHIVLDEPAGSRALCQLSWEQCTANVSHVINGVRARGVASVGLVEPYPYIPAADLVRFFELIQQAGSSPSFWHLDVDRFGIRDQRISVTKAGENLRWMARQCEAWQIPFGVIVFGQRVTTAAAYRQSAGDWTEQILTYLHDWPSRLVLESWERAPDGTYTLPHNLPESDSSSHAALVRDIAQLTGDHS